MIQIRQLSKTFSNKRSLAQLAPSHSGKNKMAIFENVSLEIQRGELFCLLGPNGSGKTTLLKILAGLISPTSGEARVEGFSILKDRKQVQRRIGLIFSESGNFYPRLSVYHNLQFFSSLYGLTGHSFSEQLNFYSIHLGLTQSLHAPFQMLSSGFQQRVNILRALLPEPPVILCDEMTKQLDPEFCQNLKNFAKKILIEQKQKTMLWVTHLPEEARAVGDRVGMLYQNRIEILAGPAQGSGS